MSINRNDLSREPTADDVDGALQSFWNGSPAALDRLIGDAVGSGASVGEVLNAVTRIGCATRRPPPPIPGYRIVRELGRGGMAVVYEAVQEATGQTVALKRVPAWGTVGTEWSSRLLEREVRTLGRLRHPGIAALYDAGRDDDECHYFVMELVAGRPITEAARGPVRDAADLRRRLALFLEVCAAVDYAHQRGVIHCDLKPTNVLVDDAGRPRVLDFGLARLLEADSGRTIGVTAIGPVGTLSHMSPEQTAGRFDAIDVRTDVYSLGVMLFELLTGDRPYAVRASALAEAVRTICELPPRRPSSLAPLVRGDVETIILKALAKSPQQRYAGVAALAADVERAAQGRPILARPPTIGYVVGRWCARHRLPTALLALLAGLIATFGVVLVGKNRELAVQRDQARAESVRLAQANGFLADLFATMDPCVVGADVSVRSFLDHAAEAIDASLPDQPAARAELHDTIGRGYFALMQYPHAVREHARAVDLYRRTYGDADPRTAAALEHYGLALLGRSDRATAERVLRQAYDIRLALFGEDDLTTARSLCSLAEFHRYYDFAEAERLLRRALDIRTRQSPDPLLLADTRYALAQLFVEAGRFAEAEPLLTQALDARVKSGATDRYEVARIHAYFGELHAARGNLGLAERDYREQIRILEKISGGRSHRDWAHGMSDLAGVLSDQGRVDEADGFHLRAVAMELDAGNDPDAALTRHNYAAFLRDMARYDEAESLERLVYQSWRGPPGGAPQTGGAYAAQCLATICLETGRLDDAERLYAEADGTWRALLGEDAPRRYAALLGLGRVAARRHQTTEAGAYFRQAYDICAKHLGETHPDTLLARFEWVCASRAEPLAAADLRAIQAALEPLLAPKPSARRETARAINRLAEHMVTYSAEESARAEPLLQTALRLEADAGLSRHPIRARTLYLLAFAALNRGAKAEAAAMAHEAVSLFGEFQSHFESERIDAQELLNRAKGGADAPGR